MKKLQLFWLLLAGLLLVTGCSDKKRSRKKSSSKEVKQEESSAGTGIFGQARLRGQIQTSVSNLKQLGTALEFYKETSTGLLRPRGMLANNRDVRYDASAAFDILVRNLYLTDTKVYVTPWDQKNALKDTTQSMTDRNVSYAYIYVGPQYSSTAPVMFEKPWLLPKGIDQINVLFADGHVESVKFPDVHKKSCREVLEFLLEYKNTKVDPKDRYRWLKYADLADQSRI